MKQKTTRISRAWCVAFVLWPLCAFAGVAAAQEDPTAYLRDRQELDALMNAGETQAAYDVVQTLNARNPDDALQWWTQGRLAARLELWSAAAEAYTRSMALGSAFESVTARRIAEAHARAGNPEAAIEWLERAVALGLDRRFALADNPAFESIADDPRFVKITGLATEDLADRAARWRHDIDFLVSEIRRMHASPRRPVDSEPFRAAAESLANATESLTDTEVMMGIQRLVVLLGDGHSYVHPSEPHEKAARSVEVDVRGLPVFFHPFGDDVYVILGQDEGADLVGGRVVAFGDEPIDRFIERADPYIHKDNPESWKFIGVQFLFRQMMLHQILGTSDDGSVGVSVEFADGRREERVLEAGRYDLGRKLRPMPGQTSVPMFLDHGGAIYRAMPFPDHSAHYVQINNFRDAKEVETLAEFATRAVDDALDAGADNLIVDFRLNNGGNNFLCEGLLRNLLRFEHADDDHRIFVITRHETFSAAQNCSNRIEAVTDAAFVGEPSASSPNFAGEETQVLLPYSGLIVSISNLYWQDSQPWDNRPWIPMDLPAALTFEAYAAGRDPALEAIFEVIAAATVESDA